MWELFSLCVVLSLQAAPSPDPLSTIKKEFQGSPGFRVEFTQKLEQDLFPEESLGAQGRIFFDRPHQLRWIYLSPASQAKELIYDGEKLFLLKDGEKEELPQPKDIALQNSFAFLWGEADLKNFNVKVVSASQFIIEPKANMETGFKQIEVLIGKRYVEKATLTDPLDGKSVFEFRNWKLK